MQSDCCVSGNTYRWENHSEAKEATLHSVIFHPQTETLAQMEQRLEQLIQQVQMEKERLGGGGDAKKSEM
jgi:hypothetical protein